MLTAVAAVLATAMPACGWKLCPPSGCVDSSSGGDTDGIPALYESYFMSDNHDYQNGSPAPTRLLGQGCRVPGDSLNEVTLLLESRLRSRRWRGLRHEDDDLMNPPTFRTEFKEATSALPLLGQDDRFADAATLAVFAGHGSSSPHTLIWSRVDASRECAMPFSQVTPDGEDIIRLGTQGGARARLAIYAASCIGFDPNVPDREQNINLSVFRDTLGQSRVWQHLTFFDSPSLNSDALGVWVDRVARDGSNALDWLGATFQAQGGTRNQPIAYTVFPTANDPSPFPFDRPEFANLLSGFGLEGPFPAGQSVGQVVAVWSQDFDVGQFADPIPSLCQ